MNILRTFYEVLTVHDASHLADVWLTVLELTAKFRDELRLRSGDHKFSSTEVFVGDGACHR